MAEPPKPKPESRSELRPEPWPGPEPKLESRPEPDRGPGPAPDPESEPGPAPEPALRLHPRAVKTVLRRARLVDPFFVGKYSYSPYHACAHGCRYCDGRAERYWVEGEFDRDIVVRTNAVELLRAELGKARERGIVFIGSGVSDAYQPPEEEARLMRRSAQALVERGFPATLLTKSSLVRRDLDVWAELNGKAGFLLMMSLVTLDDGLRQVFEPGASPIEERLATLAAFRQRGVAVGVAAMPLLPFLSDGAAETARLFRRLSEIGVDFVLPGGLTLRPGRQKEAFLATLRTARPDLVPRYAELYAENRPSGAPLAAYARDAHSRALAACAEADLPVVVPHRLYRERLPVYDEVWVLLAQLARLYPGRRRGLERLREATDRYRAWLLARKEEFNRRRRAREGELAWELSRLCGTAEWPRLLGNPKLAALLREVVLERRVFDERTLRLT